MEPVLENTERQEGGQRQGEECSDKSRNLGWRVPSSLQKFTVSTQALQKGLGRTCRPRAFTGQGLRVWGVAGP